MKPFIVKTEEVRREQVRLHKTSCENLSQKYKDSSCGYIVQSPTQF
jgi:hypothetical protein